MAYLLVRIGHLKIPGSTAAQSHFQNKPKALWALGCGLFFIFGMGFMAALQNLALPSQAKAPANAEAFRPPNRSPLAHTPGGTFEYIRLPLEEPKGFLPDTSRPLQAPRWFFENYGTAELSNLIQSCELTADQQTLLLDPHRWELCSGGISVAPPPELVLEMSRAAREKFYSILSLNEANSPQFHPFRFRPESFEQWFSDMAFSEESGQFLRKLIYRQGGAVCFCDGAIAQRLLSPAEFRRLVHSLYGEQTFIMRLVITPDTDVEGIIHYWRKGGRAEAIRPLLESMANVRGGAALNISYLLPSFAETRLYTYADANKDSDVVKQNCFWTAMNFFNEKPDPQFVSLQNTRRALAEHYRPSLGVPTYGDLVVIENAAGKPVHICVYLADDVVFTKNGADYMQPWVLMKIPDVLAYYDAREGAHLRIYRSLD